jgi:hypothetical protein
LNEWTTTLGNMEPTGPETEWAAAWVAAWSELGGIKQTREATIPTKSGGTFSYTYASLGSILETVKEVLAKHGLAISQSVMMPDNGYQGMAVLTAIFHKAGHREVFGPTTVPFAGDARAAGSAITYARRYGLQAALGIASEADDDGAEATRQQQRSDPHQAAWEVALKVNDGDIDAAKAAFKEARGAAGVELKAIISTKAEYDDVVAILTEGDDPPGGGYG